jgi:hypothetical protein
MPRTTGTSLFADQLIAAKDSQGIPWRKGAKESKIMVELGRRGYKLASVSRGPRLSTLWRAIYQVETPLPNKDNPQKEDSGVFKRK